MLRVIFFFIVFCQCKRSLHNHCAVVLLFSSDAFSFTRQTFCQRVVGKRKEAVFHKQNHLFFKTQEESVHSKIMTFKKAKITGFFVRHRIDNEESCETLGQTAPFKTTTKSLRHDCVVLNSLVFKHTNLFFVHLCSYLPLHCIHIGLNDIQVSLSFPHHKFVALKCPKVLSFCNSRYCTVLFKIYTEQSLCPLHNVHPTFQLEHK